MKKTFSVVVLSLALSGNAFAQEEKPKDTGSTTKSKSTTLTKEDREEMAKTHEKMASCLRSDRSFRECHDEMWKSKGMKAACPMGESCPMGDACPMMGRGGKKSS